MNFKKSFLSKNPLHMHGMPDPTDPPAKTGKTTFSKTDEGFKITTQQQEKYVPKTEEEAKKASDYWSSLSEEEKQEIRDRKSAKSEFEFKKLPTIKDTIDPTDMGSGDLEMAEDDSWVDEGKEEKEWNEFLQTVEESRIGSGGSSSKTKIGKEQRPSTEMTYTTSGTSDGGLYECKPGDDPVSCKMDLDAATKQEQQASAKAKKVGEKENKKMLTQSAKEQRVDRQYKEGQEKKRSKATTSKKKDRKKKAKKAKKAREKETKLLAKTKKEEKDTVTGSF